MASTARDVPVGYASSAVTKGKGRARWWRAAVPLAIGATLALLPAPEGLAPHAWYYFAIFTTVIAALVLEPLPNPAVGVIGVTLVAILSPWVLFSPEQLAGAEFDLPGESPD